MKTETWILLLAGLYLYSKFQQNQLVMSGQSGPGNCYDPQTQSFFYAVPCPQGSYVIG